MEKTFEELALDESFRMNFGNEEVPMVKVYDVVKLLQQVREATIAEVLKLADDNFFNKEPKGKLMENIENLPTDRIKIKK